MRHFLDDRGQLPPSCARPLVLFFGSIVSAVTALSRDREHALSVQCRRRPKHRRCLGEIHASLHSSSNEIYWYCPKCRYHGVISAWEDTIWDRRSYSRLNSDSASAAKLPINDGTGILKGAMALAWQRLSPEHRLRILNNVWCVSCRRGGAMKLTDARMSTGDLVLLGECMRCGGEVARVVEMAR